MMCKFVASLGGFQIAMAKANDAFEKAVFVGASGVIMAFTTKLLLLLLLSKPDDDDRARPRRRTEIDEIDRGPRG